MNTENFKKEFENEKSKFLEFIALLKNINYGTLKKLNRTGSNCFFNLNKIERKQLFNEEDLRKIPNELQSIFFENGAILLIPNKNFNEGEK